MNGRWMNPIILEKMRPRQVERSKYHIPHYIEGVAVQGHTSHICSVAYSPDGALLATGGWDRTVRLWDADTGAHLRSLAHHGPVRTVAFSPDGKTLASGGDGSAVHLWSVNSDAYEPVVIVWTTEKIRGQSVQQQSIEEPKLMTNLPHESAVGLLAFSPDGKTLVTGAADNLVRLWDVETAELLKTFEGNGAAALSPDGKTLAAGGHDRSVLLRDIETEALTATLKGHTDDVLSLAFSPDGSLLASGGNDNAALLWEVDTGERLEAFAGSNPSPKTVAWGVNKDAVISLAFSPDGKTLATGSDGNAARLWNVERGELLREIEEMTLTVYDFAFSPDGKTLAAGTNCDAVRLWRLF